MSYRITKEYVWAGAIADQIGALAEKLRALSAGGLDLELIVTRREQPGRGVMLVSPLRTMEELETAERAGLATENSYRIIRIKGPNVTGLGAKIAGALAEAGLSFRDYTAAALGDQSVTNIAFDNDEDSDRAKAILERVLAS
ncbi:MAG: hypothetical protein KAY37_14935 [Phycisphaerae bacterium]|nr:hypothetical protein [Phycisphaerae bacterium]